MVHFAASLGCVVYRVVNWNLFLDYERETRVTSVIKIKNNTK
jgi:hypothetical protein